jgi:hypothetical protein
VKDQKTPAASESRSRRLQATVRRRAVVSSVLSPAQLSQDEAQVLSLICQSLCALNPGPGDHRGSTKNTRKNAT